MNEFEILSPQTLKFNYLKLFSHNGSLKFSNSCTHRIISAGLYNTKFFTTEEVFDYRLSGELNNKIRTRLISENIIDKIYK